MRKRRKALVTGGAGFIGSNLVRTLLNNEWDVTVLDNLSSGHESNLSQSETAIFVRGDVRSRSVVDRAMPGVDTVFHLAASVGNKRSIDDPITDSETNVLGTIHVLEAARRAGVRKIVASSSAGIFGELKQLPIGEDHPVAPDTPYGASKLCEEKLCLAYAKLYAIEAVCLRYFNVYGPHQRFDAYGNVIPIFVFSMLGTGRLNIFGDGEQTRDFVNVADVVQANLKAAEAEGVSGAFNIGSGTRISINDLISHLRNASGVNPVVTYMPQRPGDVRHSLADISAAFAAFDFRPEVVLDVGLREYVNWAKKELAT